MTPNSEQRTAEFFRDSQVMPVLQSRIFFGGFRIEHIRRASKRRHDCEGCLDRRSISTYTLHDSPSINVAENGKGEHEGSAVIKTIEISARESSLACMGKRTHAPLYPRRQWPDHYAVA